MGFIIIYVFKKIASHVFREKLVNFTFEWLCDFDRQTGVVF